MKRRSFGSYVRGYFDGEFPRAVTVAERKADADARIAQLRDEGREPSPVTIEGPKIAGTFWGKGWCEHLESYSDFATRLPRGRSYVRNGCVVDLRISKGRIDALVSGSELYEVEIDIPPLEPKRWRAVVRQCAGQIDSVVELLSGALSEGVMEVLVRPENGLFPSSEEISLSCSCPDGARLCKHLAAVLYGVGARFDRAPELLFVLRGVDQDDLVKDAAKHLTAGGAGKRLDVPSEELASLFGIELATGGSALADLDAALKPPKKKRRRKLN